jgi:hypothetical protein
VSTLSIREDGWHCLGGNGADFGTGVGGQEANQKYGEHDRLEPVGVVAFVSEQGCGFRESINQQRRAFGGAHLPLAEQHDQRSTTAIADSMQLGAQAALGAPDASGNSPFLSRLAAVRCAFRWVAAIIS